jgi:hypothetical protein
MGVKLDELKLFEEDFRFNEDLPVWLEPVFKLGYDLP